MMRQWLTEWARGAYERLLRREIDTVPDHVAVIQDGNRRYARRQGDSAHEGHRAGAETTEQVLRWCRELGVSELTLYAFSTENFRRPPEERQALFDLVETKLQEFADAAEIHDNEVCIRAIGDLDRLPPRVRDAVSYAERRTADYDRFQLNVALAYGGRAELLTAARDVAAAVEQGDLDPEEIDIDAIERRLYRQPVRDVDLIVRTGGDERTSNFLPWHANGNEAAAYFCAPYWPQFSKVDFLRGIRTWQAREQSWRQTRTERAVALLQAFADGEVTDTNLLAGRLRSKLSGREAAAVEQKLDHRSADPDPNDPGLAD
jgi:tritrans,polycis-undecaprenyl-diphosphate synthase [geranylgeranyl-diphosphate specific]